MPPEAPSSGYSPDRRSCDRDRETIRHPFCPPLQPPQPGMSATCDPVSQVLDGVPAHHCCSAQFSTCAGSRCAFEHSNPGCDALCRPLQPPRKSISAAPEPSVQPGTTQPP